MSQPTLTQIMLRWVVIALIGGASLGLLCGTILLIRQRFLAALESVTLPQNFIGQMAVVTLPFSLSQIGHVRVTVQGHIFEKRARAYRDADSVTDFRVGDVVLVVDMDENHIAWVVPDWTKEQKVLEAS